MQKKEMIIYSSTEGKTPELVDFYSKTDQLSHRYLAYRDIPTYVDQYVKGKRALDYGAGTGISSSFLHDLGFNVTGVDISPIMVEKARASFSHIQFYEIPNFQTNDNFDLVFSSFVLFDIGSKKEIINYLSKAAFFMEDDGVFIGITGSEHLYSVSREWEAFESRLEENHNLCSGDVAKIILKDQKIKFYDYFWKETDYIDCFEESGLKILKIHRPLGLPEDPYAWKDECYFAPFIIFVARKFKT